MSHHQYAQCIEACYTCAAACDHCATACLSEDNVEKMADCIRSDMDCAQKRHGLCADMPHGR